MTGVVDLHIWSLAASADNDRYLIHLSADEIARKDRFVFERDQTAFLVGRGRLREILSGEMDIPPADIRFDYGANGKPFVADGPTFNLSHSDGIACLAVHTDMVLGVDIEGHRDVERDVARRFFSPTEYAALMALPDEDRQAGFFRCWTRKEAIVKALGGGLSIPLDAFDVTLSNGTATLKRLDDSYGEVAEWALATFQIGDQMPGAVAAKHAGELRLFLASCDPGIIVTL